MMTKDVKVKWPEGGYIIWDHETCDWKHDTSNRMFGVVARLKPPHGYVGRWVNVYKFGTGYQAGGMYTRKSDADHIAKKHRYDCIYVHVRKNVK